MDWSTPPVNSQQLLVPQIASSCQYTWGDPLWVTLPNTTGSPHGGPSLGTAILSGPHVSEAGRQGWSQAGRCSGSRALDTIILILVSEIRIWPASGHNYSNSPKAQLLRALTGAIVCKDECDWSIVIYSWMYIGAGMWDKWFQVGLWCMTKAPNFSHDMF